jgi:protease-4
MKKYRRLLIAVCLGLVLFLVLTRSSEPEIKTGSTLVMTLDGAYLESTGAPLLSQLLGETGVSFAALRSELKKAARDERLANVVLRIRAPQLGWAQAQELRDSVLALRAAGRHTVAYLETASFVSNNLYYLATAADEIQISPGAMVGVIGLAGEYLFLGAPWEEIGVDFEVARVGRYKTFADSFAESSMSEAGREQANSLLDSINEQFLTGIAEGRGLSKEFVERSIDDAPMLPGELEALGFVDGVGFLEEILETLGGTRVDSDEYAGVAAATVGIVPVANLALIYGSGNVVVGRGQSRPGSGLVMASDTVSKAFDDAAADPSIDAIIFRIDSPGGSVLASDLVWNAIERAKTHGKPVIATMANVAASGGYYVAAAADAIVASPSTITGSIGVIAVRPVIRELLEKFDIGVEVLARGQHADMFVLSQPLAEASRERFDEQVRDVYQLFINRVAGGRGMPADRVDELGRGRVWTGEQAFRNGLVDELGGLTAAIGLAKARLGLDPEDDVELIAFPPPLSLPAQLASSFTFAKAAIRAVANPSLPGVLGRAQSWLEVATWEAPMLLPPYVVEIR